jgi:hypothetical protein
MTTNAQPTPPLPTELLAPGVDTNQENLSELSISSQRETAAEQVTIANAPLFERDDTPSLFDAVLASARLANAEASAAQWLSDTLRDDPEADPDFDPFEFTKANMRDARIAKVLPVLADGRPSRRRGEGH